MHRIGGKINLFSNVGHKYGEEDPRIKSKCSTPKRHDNRKSNEQLQQQDSHTQTLTKKTAYFAKTHSSQQAKDQLQKQLIKKIESYNVVSGTLKQYFKQQKSNKNNRKNKNNKSQVLNTTVEMIKAFARTQITEVSPHLTQLITQMLDTLPLSSAKARNKKCKSIKRLDSNKDIFQNEKKHSRQFSFAKNKQKQVRKQKEKRIKTQIQTLEQNLQDLRQQGEVLQSIRDQFDEMTESNKREYIRELQQIIEKQQQMLDQLNDQS